MKQNNSKNKYGAGKSKKCLLIIVEISLFLLFIFSTSMTIMQVQQAKHEQEAFSDLASIVLDADQEIPETQAPATHPPYQNLYEMNNDFIGWLTISNTNIDYPVMFTPDEPEYYLRRAFDKTSSQSGTPFIGENGNIDSDCLIIYGHNMKNGSMFAQLHKFEDPDFFDANREVLIYLPGEVLHYTIFAAHIYDDRHLLYSFDFTDPEVYQKYLDSIFSTRDMSANIDKDITVTTDDQIITLVTCIGSQPNNRLLVQAVLTDREPGVETARAAAATE